jgi:hypothetical protein
MVCRQSRRRQRSRCRPLNPGGPSSGMAQDCIARQPPGPVPITRRPKGKMGHTGRWLPHEHGPAPSTLGGTTSGLSQKCIARQPRRPAPSLGSHSPRNADVPVGISARNKRRAMLLRDGPSVSTAETAAPFSSPNHRQISNHLRCSFAKALKAGAGGEVLMRCGWAARGYARISELARCGCEWMRNAEAASKSQSYLRWPRQRQ